MFVAAEHGNGFISDLNGEACGLNEQVEHLDRKLEIEVPGIRPALKRLSA
jgi:hypothetical protein